MTDASLTGEEASSKKIEEVVIMSATSSGIGGTELEPEALVLPPPSRNTIATQDDPRTTAAASFLQQKASAWLKRKARYEKEENKKQKRNSNSDKVTIVGKVLREPKQRMMLETKGLLGGRRSADRKTGAKARTILASASGENGVEGTSTEQEVEVEGFPTGAIEEAPTISHPESANTPQPLVEAELVPDVETLTSGRPGQPDDQQNEIAPAENVSGPEIVFEAKPMALMTRRRTVLLFATLLLVTTGVVVAAILVSRASSGGKGGSNKIVEDLPQVKYPPTLARVSQAGILHCSISSEFVSYLETATDVIRILGPNYTFNTSVSEFFLGLCKAIASGALGQNSQAVLVSLKPEEEYEALENRTIDVIMGPQKTVWHDVVGMDSGGPSLAFSAPYLFNSFYAYGVPHYVDCFIDSLRFTGNCSGINICVLDKGSWTYLTPIPRRHYTTFPTMIEGMGAFLNGTCNVIDNLLEFDEYEELLALFGYTGEVKRSRFPIARSSFNLVTLDEDPEWSNFVNAIIFGLLAADKLNVTQQSAGLFMETDAFGDAHKTMFIDAISTVGNYGELRERTLGIFTRDIIMNEINNGNSGLMTTLQGFSGTEVDGPGPSKGGRLETILERGQLMCAVRMMRTGFAMYSGNTNSTLSSELSGIDIDMCRAVSAAIFFGDIDASIAWIEVEDEVDAYALLASGEVDVAAGITWTFRGQVNESATGQAFSFSQPYFFGPADLGNESLASFPENLCLATIQNDTQFSSFVYWIVASTIAAAEYNIDSESADIDKLGPVNLFGPRFSRMFQDALLAVGNYLEIYERNLEQFLPLSGRNLIPSYEHESPLHYVPPGFYRK